MHSISMLDPLKIKAMSNHLLLPRSLQALLADVSRSFGLTLRLLPSDVRPIISLAYLLARISDTLADAAQVPIPHRVLALQTWLELVATPPAHGHTPRPDELPPLLAPYRLAPPIAAEVALLEQASACLDALTQCAPADQDSIRRVMHLIGLGQLQDLQRGLHPLATLETEDDLNTYTWQVAGCVGQFWTQCLQAHLPHTLGLPASEMHTLGQHYGQGLQRLNILLDAAQDLHNGRCYFPTQTLQTLGLTPEQLQHASAHRDMDTLTQLAALQTQWFEQVEHALRNGLRYSCALRNWRLRLASALPALIGAASLQLLRQQPTTSWVQRLKWPRATLQKHLLLLLLQGANPKALERHFEQLLRGKAAPRNATITP